MAEVIATYGLEGVAIIGFAVIVALVGLANWIYNFYIKSRQTKEDYKHKVINEEKFYERIDKVEQANVRQDETLAEQSRKLDLLVESDIGRIKGELLKQYQYFSRKGYIDSLALEYLHHQYDVYRKEGGNSWAQNIMEKIDNLELKDD